MPNALILHGTGDKPTDFWFPGIKTLLESGGYEVSVPHLPHPDRPVLADSLSMVFENVTFHDSSIIIAHSSGCPLVLSILERIEAPIEQAICVSGFYQPIDANPDAPLMLQDHYDWQRIRQHTRELILINSDNDPWGCNDAQARAVAAELAATFVIPIGQGHMGSETFGQPYREFPLLERLISRTFFS